MLLSLQHAVRTKKKKNRTSTDREMLPSAEWLGQAASASGPLNEVKQQELAGAKRLQQQGPRSGRPEAPNLTASQTNTPGGVEGEHKARETSSAANPSSL